MSCCLMAPSHYLNQCWLLIIEVLWHPPDSNFKVRAQAIIQYRYINFKTATTSPRGQWVDLCCPTHNLILENWILHLESPFKVINYSYFKSQCLDCIIKSLQQTVCLFYQNYIHLYIKKIVSNLASCLHWVDFRGSFHLQFFHSNSNLVKIMVCS